MTNQIWYLEKNYFDEVNYTSKMSDENNRSHKMGVLILDSGTTLHIVSDK